jgi:CDP-diacylglycerol--glycerol-3-phosphate 3-phosphatidyltransferase
MNLPNQITLARLVLAVLVFVLIPWGQYWLALVLFLLAAATDWLDGYWARRTGQVTKLGRVLDPFVDKFLICGAFIYLAAEPRSGIAAWMSVVVVARELLVTVLRSFLEGEGVDFSAQLPGKLKMVFQCGAVVASLWVLSLADQQPPQWLAWGLVTLVWLAILTTIYSGIDYVIQAAKLLGR